MKNLFDKFDVLDGIPLFLIPVVFVGVIAYAGFVVYINSVALGWIVGIPAFFAGLLYYGAITKVTAKEGNTLWGFHDQKLRASLVWLNQIVICHWLVTASGFGAIGYIFVMLVVLPALCVSTNILLSREVKA